MNEPIQHAQKTTGNVTVKDLLAVMKAGPDSASLHARASHDRASYSDSTIFKVVSKKENRRNGERVSERETTIEIPGWVSNGHTHEGETFRPQKGFWWLYAIQDRVVDILEILPKNAEVAFHVYLEAGTTEGLKKASMHADHLYLVAWLPGKKVRTFLVDARTGEHNTARFGEPGSRI